MNIAVLIDAENIDRTTIPEIFARLSDCGRIDINRAYGDWGTSNLRGWKNTLNAFNITPIQQFTYTQGKNASDIALVIDAMDLLYQKSLDMFVLVSSDSDFTKLASRLKDAHKRVLGFGSDTAPTSLRQACDTFICVEAPVKPPKTVSELEQKPSTSAITPIKKSSLYPTIHDPELIHMLVSIVTQHANDKGWVSTSTCGTLIKKHDPEFHYKNYGCKTLTQLFECTECFILKKPKKSAANRQTYIRNNLPLLKLSTWTWI